MTTQTPHRDGLVPEPRRAPPVTGSTGAPRRAGSAAAAPGGRRRRLARAVGRGAQVLGIAAVAAAARLYALDSIGFNSDEAVYAGQAASITGDPATLPYFPVFRAHPLLFQSAVSVVYHFFGVSDVAARLTAVAFGMAAIWVTFLVGREVHSRGAGLLAALLLAVMPYHVVVSRQVLLDGPQALMSTAALYGVARFTRRRETVWLYLAAAFLGVSVIAKETSVILLGAGFVYFALAPGVRLRRRHVALAGVVLACVVVVYPLSLRLAGAAGTGGAFLTYQLFRPPNHALTFYPTVVPPALGFGVVIAALLGLWMHRRRFGWPDALLWSWVAVPAVFFELFPVKGYQYLLPIAAPMAVLAARTLLEWPAWLTDRPRGTGARWLRRSGTVPAWLSAGVVLVVSLSLAVPAWAYVVPGQRDTFLAGTGGVPGGRELGAWIDAHVPVGVTIMTIGPSMANLIQWYGHREAKGLSVSPNPLYRNPVYDPIPNPDLAIRRNQVQYVVWDTFSAQRSTHFSEALQGYVDRFHGREVHRQSTTSVRNGRSVPVPAIIVYEVRP